MTATEPTRLVDVPAFLCPLRPGRFAPAVEWAAFYERSAALYSRVAFTDAGNRDEALIIAGLDRDKAADYRKEINTPQ